ncbi:PilZ domain-containing protein [Microvirga rosea]|uniref:PilZ domain-containing protein n=1 Tax=Microvirga rosea TaxID=2715425 RepID=UPI001D0A63EA|nr:PilZ domain-containing protein [Microvirga rosea]
MASGISWTSYPKNLDLRRSRRRRAQQPAKIVTGPETMIHCEVCDISAGGAKLIIRDDLPLPDFFKLYIVGHTLQVFEACLRWRGGGYAGVSFEMCGAGEAERRTDPAYPPLFAH